MGFWKCHHQLRALRRPWNHKRVYRAYYARRSNHVRRTKKRIHTRVQLPLTAMPQLNDLWAMNLMGDTLYRARRYRIFNVIGEGHWEALAIEVDVLLPSEQVGLHPIRQTESKRVHRALQSPRSTRDPERVGLHDPR